MNFNAKKKERSVSSFLKKTLQILQDTENQKVVRWSHDGKGFIVYDEDAFSKLVLPKYFKHSNYSSFVRQLNMYNFHKMRESGSESFFYHEHFKRNDNEAIYQIKRKPQKKKKKGDQQNQQSESSPQINSMKKKEVSVKTKTILKQKSLNNQCTKNLDKPQHNNCFLTQDRKLRFQIHEDDNLSIDNQIEEKRFDRPVLGTKQLICPSNTNFYASLQNNEPSIFSIGSLIK